MRITCNIRLHVVFGAVPPSAQFTVLVQLYGKILKHGSNIASHREGVFRNTECVHCRTLSKPDAQKSPKWTISDAPTESRTICRSSQDTHARTL